MSEHTYLKTEVFTVDIVEENAIPAFLESHQLMFELESIGLYNDIILTNQAKEYDLQPQIEVQYDLSKEKINQKRVDEGLLPWRIDPITNSQTFLEIALSNNELVGEGKIEKTDLTLLHSTLDTAIVEVKSQITDIKYIYLKRLVRQTPTGIWTVIGYDSLEK